MINSLDKLNKQMRCVLNTIIKNGVLDLQDENIAIALHECLKNEFIENVEEWKDANGKYHFQEIGLNRVTGEGLKFLKETSKLSLLVNGVFKIFRGFLGFILGIVSTLITTYLMLEWGWIEK